MANSNGQCIEGDYVGFINKDSYPLFVEHEGRHQFVTTSNQIGFAISERELFVHIPDYIDV